MALSTTSAFADFERWSVETEDDPFSGGQKIVVNYMSTLRSGVFIFCDSAQPGIKVRAVPGWNYVSDLEGFEPTMEFAFDGTKLLSARGATGAVGDNIAAAEVTLLGEQAEKFAQAFAAASKQVAIRDGISDQPHLLRASGSTKSGQALAKCIQKQR
jgi:hypothetical protein